MEKSLRQGFNVRIFQPIVPEYRVALFSGLAARFGGSVDVWAADQLGVDVSYPVANLKTDYRHRFLKAGPFLWQKGLSLKGLKTGDVIVVCGDVHQLSSLWIACRAKSSGIKVVWWGHHKTATSKPLGVKIRLFIAKMLSDVYLCYTDTGRDWLKAHGFTNCAVFATGNTINQQPIKNAISRWDDSSIEAWKTERGLIGKKLLLCCSVLREKTRLDLAIQALADGSLRSRNVILAIIGDGPAKSKYEKIADEFGVSERIIWVGATRDQEVMAPWFLSAKLFVYPGSIGLSILHAFSYGLPVITHGNADHHGPEFEVMKNGWTGGIFDEGDLVSMISTIVMMLDSPAKLSDMSAYVKRVAYERYSMDNMVANFYDAIEAAVKP